MMFPMRPAGKPAVPIVNTAHKLTAVLAALIHLFLMLRPSLLFLPMPGKLSALSSSGLS
jgi:hypothetical protein